VSLTLGMMCPMNHQARPAGADTKAERIYEEALLGRERQDGRLESLRGRAALLFTAAAIALTIFVGNTPSGWWAALTGVAFAGLLFCVTKVVQLREWHDIPNLYELVDFYLDDENAPDERTLCRDLTLVHADLWERNELALRSVKKWFSASVWGVGLLVALLVIARLGASS
jgi:hypothetical protein